MKDNCLFHRKGFQVSVPINSLASGRYEFDSKNVIFNLVLLNGILKSSQDNTPWWMPQDFTDDKSTLVQVMAWCRQATIHYLSQCWLSSLSPYGIARPPWAKKWYHIQVYLQVYQVYSSISFKSWKYPASIMIHPRWLRDSAFRIYRSSLHTYHVTWPRSSTIHSSNIRFEWQNQMITKYSSPHWYLNKMATILQTTFSNVFSWRKMFVFWLKFHCSLFLLVQQIISQNWFRYCCSVPNGQQAITWTNDDQVLWWHTIWHN